MSLPAYLLCLTLFCSGTRAVATTALGNIWPIGDSITYGAEATGGYRDPLYSQLTAAGYTFTLVGNRTDNSTTLLNTAGQARHDGYPGYTITNIVSSSFGGLYENVTHWHATISQPDIILLMIGINDLNHDYDIATAPDRLDLLITRLFTVCPAGRIIVASVLDAEEDNPYRGGATNDLAAAVSAYNTAMVAIVNQRRDLGQNIGLVDMNAGLTFADLTDGLHPNPGGYAKMGDLWANAIMAIAPRFSTNGIRVSGETVSLTATGAAGTSYSLWATTNLVLMPDTNTWTELTNSTVAVSPFTITDQGAITNAQRFYLFRSP